MSIHFSCPITGEQRDNTTVRVVAGMVFFISALVLWIGSRSSAEVAVGITGILAIDFVIRAFFKPKYSPLATLGRGIVSILNLPRKMVDSGSKIFAARIGVLFSIVTTLLFAFQLQTAALVILGILLICAGLEAFLGFCLGCWLYSLLPTRIGNLLAKEFLR